MQSYIVDADEGSLSPVVVVTTLLLIAAFLLGILYQVVLFVL